MKSHEEVRHRQEESPELSIAKVLLASAISRADYLAKDGNDIQREQKGGSSLTHQQGSEEHHVRSLLRSRFPGRRKSCPATEDTEDKDKKDKKATESAKGQERSHGCTKLKVYIVA